MQEGYGTCVCVSVCLSVCLSDASVAATLLVSMVKKGTLWYMLDLLTYVDVCNPCIFDKTFCNIQMRICDLF